MSFLALIRSRGTSGRINSLGYNGLKVIYVKDKKSKEATPKPAISVATETEARTIVKKAKKSNISDKQILNALSMEFVQLDSANNALNQLESALNQLAALKAQEEYIKAVQAKKAQVEKLLAQNIKPAKPQAIQQIINKPEPITPPIDGLAAADEEDILLLLAMMA